MNGLVIRAKIAYLVLSMLGSLEVADFSQITGMRSGYLSLILSASAFLVSVTISELEDLFSIQASKRC